MRRLIQSSSADTGRVVLADAEVRRPAPQVLPQLVQPVVHADAPASSRQLLDPVLEVRQGLVGPANLVALDREAQKAAFAHRRCSAFGRVDRELEASLQVSRDAEHHPLGGAFTLDQNNQIIGVAGEAVAPPVQLLVDWETAGRGCGA